MVCTTPTDALLELDRLLPSYAATYGYTAENASLARHFLRGEQPLESLSNGLQVVEFLMAAYRSAQNGETVTWPVDLEDFVPDVAQGIWNPRG